MLDTKAITKDQEKFYQALFSNFGNHIEIRLIRDGQPSKQMFFTYKELLNYQVPMDMNAYVGIYERKHKGNGKITNCTKSNAIYLDFDGMALDEIRYRIDHSKVPQPSMIVSSGNGFHVYWLLEDQRGHELKPIIKKLVEVLGADPVATDIARILRIPDTNNLKEDPLPTSLVELNSNRATVQQFENVLNVKATIDKPTATGVVKELAEIKINGLNNMASGVGKGKRNFCTGRIVQTLRRLNYTKLQMTGVVMRWNSLNSPVKASKELKKDINTYWHQEQYRYDGKEFSDDRLEELNKQFIDADTTYFMGGHDSFHSYDNELLRPDVFKKTRGLTFAALSIIKLAGSDGIRKEHLADLSNRNVNDQTLRKSINLLEQMKYIKVVTKKLINYYVFTEKGNYTRGYTAVSKSLHRSYINKELQEHEYKLMILIESYAYDNKKTIYTGNQTLALASGQSVRTIRRNLKQLEHRQFIKQSIKGKQRFITLIYR